MRELPLLVAELEPGIDADLTVLRDRKEREISVEISKMPENPQVAASKGKSDKESASTETALGLEFAPLDDRARERYGLEEGVQGLVGAYLSAGLPVAATGIPSESGPLG